MVASAMGGFASALQELEPRRKQLIADAEAFNLKGCPVDKAEHAQQMAEGEQLQQSINTLVEEYRQKIKDCTTHLEGINSEGDYPDPNAPDINGAALGQVPNLGTSIAQSREFMKLRVSRALRLWTNIGDTKVMQWLANRKWLPSWLGKIKGSIRIPLPPRPHRPRPGVSRDRVPRETTGRVSKRSSKRHSSAHPNRRRYRRDRR